MKKSNSLKNYFLKTSIFLVLLAICACAKTTKGKITEEWKITEMHSNSEYTSATNVVSTDTKDIINNTYTHNFVLTQPSIPVSSSTENGTVSQGSWTISKDGNWTRTLTYSVKDSVEYSETDSGTWSFVGKTKGDDFIKNERVLFNTLSVSTTEKTLSSGSVKTISENYLTGQKNSIFTVVESKSDLLKLEIIEDNSDSSSDGYTTVYKNNVTYLLNK